MYYFHYLIKKRIFLRSGSPPFRGCGASDISICYLQHLDLRLKQQIKLSAGVANPNAEGTKLKYQRRHSLGRGKSRS